MTAPRKPMSAHSKEPWKIRAGSSIESGACRLIAVCSLEPDTRRSELNAKRIVACVNACAGMADPAAEIAALRECAEALDGLLSAQIYEDDTDRALEAKEAARAALAKLPKV